MVDRQQISLMGMWHDAGIVVKVPDEFLHRISDVDECERPQKKMRFPMQTYSPLVSISNDTFQIVRDFIIL